MEIVMKEIWKETKYKNYFVSNKGRVKSIDRMLPPDAMHPKGQFKKGKTLTPHDNGHGYLTVMLTIKTATQKRPYIHRLVAETFIPNPQNKKQINHKNGIKSDNSVKNLEWATRSENVKHSYDVLKRQRGGKPCKCINTGKIYSSTYEAGREIGIKGERIQYAIKSGGFCKGSRWEYIKTKEKK